jgi:hypothetical protein
LKKVTAILCLLLAGMMIFAGCSQTGNQSAEATGTPAASATDKVVVAEVNGEPIYYDDYYAILTQMGVSADDEDSDYYKESVVQSLVTEKVMKKMLTEKGYMELNEEQMATAEADAEADLKSYIEYYYSTDITADLGDDYTDEEYQTALNSAVDTHKQEVLDSIGMTWDQLLENYKLSVAEDAAKKDMTGDLAPTDDEVKAKYDENVASDKEAMEEDPTVYESDVMYGTTVYYVPGGLHTVKQILIKIDDKMSEAIGVLRDNGYDDQADMLQEKAMADIKAKADEALAKIKSGELTFDEAIAQYNQDDSMPEGGYPVSSGTDTYEEAFTTGAMALKNINDISELVATDYGYHIIQYVGDTTAGAVALDKVKDELYDSLKTTLQDDKWTSITDEWTAQSNAKYYPENY